MKNITEIIKNLNSDQIFELVEIAAQADIYPESFNIDSYNENDDINEDYSDFLCLSYFYSDEDEEYLKFCLKEIGVNYV